MSQFQRGDEPSGYVHLLHTVLSESSHVESLQTVSVKLYQDRMFQPVKEKTGGNKLFKTKKCKNKVIKIKHIKEKNMMRK